MLPSKLQSACILVPFSKRSVSLLCPYLLRNHWKRFPKTIFGSCSNDAWKVCTVNESRSAKKLLTSALFMCYVSEKSVCSPSKMAFATCLPTGVSCSALSQLPGLSRVLGYASLLYCAYVFSGTHVCRKFGDHILMSHGFEHMELGVYLEP